MGSKVFLVLPVWICYDIILPIFYSLVHAMNVPTPQLQGQTEKMLNYEVSVLDIFSVCEQKS